MTHYNEHEGQTCPLCGDTMTATHSNYAPVWSDRHDNIVCTTCAETTEKDPTPAHGTPRPQAHPCSVPFCDYFTATPRHFCEGHASVIGNAPHLLAFAEGWLIDHADPEHSADLLALRFFTSCLDVIHAFVIGSELGEGALVETALRTGSLLLGRVACDTCGDSVDPEELDVNGMCEHCRDEAEHA